MLHHLFPLLVIAIGAGPEGVSVPDIVKGNSQFAVELYAREKVTPGNLFFSPYSISTALAMTSTGAVGDTAREMAATLHLPADRNELEAGYEAMEKLLSRPEAKKLYQLDTANALWGQKGLDYRADFLKRTEAAFGATLHPVDFANDPEGSRRTINEWVEQRTHERIKNLLSPSAITRDTDLILTNAIYFKAPWLTPFPKGGTTDREFSTPTGKVQTPMMHQIGEFRYLDPADEGLQILDLPYARGELSMVVLLPKAVDGLSTLEASLTAKLEGWLGNLTKGERVDISFPRFKLESSMKLSSTLGSLGMKRAFSPDADFSGITTDRRLYISDVIHKAYADVNEEGTEAAAATAVGMARASAMVPRKPPVVFAADHPFLFLIRDLRTGSILFIGRVVNPRS